MSCIYKKKEKILMLKFIEEFYYGNIDPQARSTKENKAVQKQMEVLMLNEDFLTEKLSGESKKKSFGVKGVWSILNTTARVSTLHWLSVVKLNRYLVDINKQAEAMFDTLVSNTKPLKVSPNNSKRITKCNGFAK